MKIIAYHFCQHTLCRRTKKYRFFLHENFNSVYHLCSRVFGKVLHVFAISGFWHKYNWHIWTNLNEQTDTVWLNPLKITVPSTGCVLRTQSWEKLARIGRVFNICGNFERARYFWVPLNAFGCTLVFLGTCGAFCAHAGTFWLALVLFGACGYF